MKKLRVFVAGTLAAGLVGTAIAQSETTDPEHKFELAKGYYQECEGRDSEHFEQIRPYIKAFTDMKVMADTMADPRRLMKLIDVVNDPATVHIMAKCSTEPVMWDTWVRGVTSLNSYLYAMTKAIDPNLYLNWTTAWFDLELYKNMVSQMDPRRYLDWASSAMRPQFYNPLTGLLELDWYTKRLNWMLSLDSYKPALNLMTLGQIDALKPKAEAPAAQ